MKLYNQFLLAPALAVFVLGSSLLPPLEQPPNAGSQEMSGVWVSDYGASIAKGRQTIQSEVKEIVNSGYSKVYVSVYTPRVAWASTIPYTVTPSFVSSWLYLNEVNAQGIEAQAWLEYGLKMHSSQSFYKNNPEAFLGIYNGMAWLDPSHPKTKSYILQLVEDASDPFFVKGIHLDDNWSIPSHFGDHSAALTSLTKSVKEHVVALSRLNGKPITLSLSANPLPYAQSKQNQDWLHWIELGIVDEMTVQVYRPTETFQKSIELSGIDKASKHIPVSVGVSAIGGLGNDLATVKEQYAILQEMGYAPALFTYEHAKYNQWHRSLANIASKLAR